MSDAPAAIAQLTIRLERAKAERLEAMDVSSQEMIAEHERFSGGDTLARRTKILVRAIAVGQCGWRPQLRGHAHRSNRSGCALSTAGIHTNGQGRPRVRLQKPVARDEDSPDVEVEDVRPPLMVALRWPPGSHQCGRRRHWTSLVRPARQVALSGDSTAGW
jgi:hypothetical protein